MKVWQTMAFIISVMAILAAVSLVMPEDGVQVGEHTYRLPKLSDLFSIEKKETKKDALQRMQAIEEELTAEENAKTEEDRKLEQEIIQKEAEKEKRIKIRDDSFREKLGENPAQIYMPDGNLHYLDGLFAELDSCTAKNEIIHIMHYGDSQIEADRISSYIRKSLQDKFGGNGPGMLPIVQPITSYTVRQTKTDGLTRYMIDGTMFVKTGTDNKRYGALAQFATFEGKEEISIRTKLQRHNGFSNIRLFVGNTGDNFAATMLQGDLESTKDTKTIDKANEGASVITWKLTNDIKKITLRFEGKGELYGVALDGQSGVAVDNVPMRGSRGTFFTRMEKSLFKYMHSQLNTRLIILEFGGNAMPMIKVEKDIDAYQQLLKMQIAWIKDACPGVPIILIGPADMSQTVDGVRKTRPLLPENKEAMKKTALENGIAFWDMYEVMGGYNSMLDWVSQRPQLAISDYTHLSNRGAERIAKVFMESFMKHYDHYKENQQAELGQKQTTLQDSTQVLTTPSGND